VREQELVRLLTLFLGVGVKKGNYHYNFKCPKCKHHNNKLAVQVVPDGNTDTAWRCFHCETTNQMSGKSIKSLLVKASCPKHISDQIYELLSLKRSAPVVLEYKQIQLPKEFVRLYRYTPSNDYEYVVYNEVLEYLIKERRLTIYDIVKYNIGMCVTGDYAKRVVIPSYDSNNALNFFVTRSIYKESKAKHKNPDFDKSKLVPFENTINWNEPIIVVEGAFDAMSIKRNALPLLGKTLSEPILKKLLSSSVNKIYMCLDNDARKAALVHCEKLMKFGKEVYFVDLNGKDPNEIGFSKVNSILQNTYPLTFSELIKLKMEAVK
jgi:hypothetical protein